MTRTIRLAPLLLLFAPVAFLVVLFLAPIGYMGVLSLEDKRGTWGAYQELWNDNVYWFVLVRTFRTAFLVALISVLTAYPTAWVLTQLKGIWRQVGFWCVLFPLWMSALTRTFSWMLLLDKGGPIASVLQAMSLTDSPPQLLYTTLAVYLGMVHVMLPFAIFPIYAAMLGIDGRLLQASEGLGATPLRTFLKVQLPLTMPGVFSAGTLVFLVSLGFFVTPAMLGGLQNSTVASLIEMLIHERFATSTAAAVAIVLLLVTLLVVLLCSRVLRGANPART
jgi:ABC-type spermidine/putrescine transport system permease subunit I